MRSHQDTKNTKTDNEVLNDRADELATECRNDANQGLLLKNKKQIYEGSMATLTINNNVINKDVKKAIQTALYSKIMKTYTMEKYGWTKDTFDAIDWDSLDMALTKKKGIQKVTIHKLLHFWQPTNKYTQRNQRRRTKEALCTECNCVDEQMHYMKCQSQYFKEARGFAWKRFCDKMKYYLREESMIRVMSIGIKNWIYQDFNEPLPRGDEINTLEYTALVNAYNSQNEIGWDHFLAGKVSKEWSKYYSMRLPESKEKHGKVLAFGKTLVESIWIYTLGVWKLHNEAVHGKKGSYSNRDVIGIKECVKKLCDLRKYVSAEDEWLFYIEAKIRTEHPVPQMIGWVERVLLCFNDDDKKVYPVLNQARCILYRMCKTTIYS